MSTTIESLELEILSNSKSASNGIKSLAKSLEQLRNATKGGSGLNAVEQQLAEINKVLKPAADQMKIFSDSLKNASSNANDLSKKIDKSSSSTTKFISKITGGAIAIRKLVNGIMSFVNKSADYTENVNLFTVSMGEYASEAKAYAQTVSDMMGIDPGEWMRAQGVFMTMATGFGVASDRAKLMSQNLTQLGYDIASFYNLDINNAMDKLKSGLAGELEPLRAIGYDLSQAKLEATALSLGIDKSVSSMTQAEKAQLRYYAIMTQVTDVQGDMARTLDDPANQLRVFKSSLSMAGREIGNVFIPALNAILPYAIAVTKVVGSLASVIAGLFGFDSSELKESSATVVENTDAIQESLKDAQEETKKLKSYMLGFDELNVINPNTDATDDTSGVFDFELPDYSDTFLSGLVDSKVSIIVEEMKEWLGITDDIDTWAEFLDTRLGNILETVGLIAIGLASWKIASGVASTIDAISKIKFNGLEFVFKATGLTLLLSDLDKLKQYFDDFVENGATFSNVTGMLSEFAGALGDVMIVLGKVELGGALKVIQGLGEIASAISDIAENGVDFTNITDLIRGLSNVMIGVGFLTKNAQLAGVGMIIQGLTTIIQELAENWEAIKKGDWSGVDKVALVIGAITAIGGIVVALQNFKKVKDTVDTVKTVESIKEVATATESISTTTSTMTTKLTSLAKNLGLGIAIIAEIAAAAILFVGAIWVLGKELEQVGIAWEPVLANGETIIIAIGLGTALLATVGVVTAAIGTMGAPLIVNIALGTAMLAEIGVASALFLAEILVVGLLLNEIGKAWQPVLDNGETIKKGIDIGTGLLVAIGVVAAALGAAAVASVGLLPVAIALGTAMLIELGIAFIAFTNEIIDVANQLADNLAPSLSNVILVLPDLADNMAMFTSFMATFAGHVVSFTLSTTISGIAATVSKFIGFFTTDPIQMMNDEISTQHLRMSALIVTLNGIMPVIQEATGLAKDYNQFMDEFSLAAGTSNGIGSSTIWGALVLDISTAWDSISKKTEKVWTTIKEKFSSVWTAMVNFVKDPINSIISGMESLINGVIGGINGLINALNKINVDAPDWVTDLTGIGSFGFNINTLSTVSLPRFAEGGFPESGQAFIARENGIPEMVGTIGRRTAVANNQQIVESVASGVAEANGEQNALLREQNSLLRALLEKDSSVYLDGRSLSDSVDKYKREQGRVIIAGGVL